MIRALLIVLVGAASFAAVYFLMPPQTETAEPTTLPQEAPRPPEPAAIASIPPEEPRVPVTFDLRPGTETATAEGDAPARSIRDVTPDNMTAGPRITGTLTRVAPPAKPTEARTERLFSPIVVAAGTIHARDRDIHLAGIAAPEFEARCGEGQEAWPCGRMARAALRSFIRGRAIECAIPAGADKIPDPAQCLVGGDDISEWLVAQGWAKRSGEFFAAAEKKAQDAKLGLWGDGRPDDQPEVATSG